MLLKTKIICNTKTYSWSDDLQNVVLCLRLQFKGYLKGVNHDRKMDSQSSFCVYDSAVGSEVQKAVQLKLKLPLHSIIFMALQT